MDHVHYDEKPSACGLTLDFLRSLLGGCPTLRVLCEGWDLTIKEALVIGLRRVLVEEPAFRPASEVHMRGALAPGENDHRA